MKLPVRYRADGQSYISVTQVLSLRGRIDSQWFTPESALRGQMVHDLTEVMDRGGPMIIPAHLTGYLDAYAKFLQTVRPVYAASEVEIVSTGLGFAGRLDRVCRDLFGAPGILDFKTGAPAAWHGQQLAAYNMLRPTGNRWACYLRADGRYKLMTYHDPIDHRRFLYDLAQTRGTITAFGDHWISIT